MKNKRFLNYLWLLSDKIGISSVPHPKIVCFSNKTQLFGFFIKILALGLQSILTNFALTHLW